MSALLIIVDNSILHWTRRAGLTLCYGWDSVFDAGPALTQLQIDVPSGALPIISFTGLLELSFSVVGRRLVDWDIKSSDGAEIRRSHCPEEFQDLSWKIADYFSRNFILSAGIINRLLSCTAMQFDIINVIYFIGGIYSSLYHEKNMPL